MDCRTINLAILNSRDLPPSFVKSEGFYHYLRDNSVAYYYAKVLCRKKGDWEKGIIEEGEKLNDKYIRTLRLVNRICKRKRIKFLVFKTFKYIPEVVDGDIDLFIKERDFYKFLNAFREENFKCVEDEHLKGRCEKFGLCKIEPRVNVSHHGFTVFKESQIWEFAEKQKMGDIDLSKTTKEFDLFCLSLGALYGPKYIRLYEYLLVKKVGQKRLLSLASDKRIGEDLQALLRIMLVSSTVNMKFPLFVRNVTYLKWWLKRITPNRDISIFSRLKHLAFFFYMKYKYVFFNSLYFGHKWFNEIKL